MTVALCRLTVKSGLALSVAFCVCVCEFLASVARLCVCLPVRATLLSCPLRVRLVKRIPRLDINSLRHRAPVTANVTIPISRNNGLSAVTFNSVTG